MRVNVIITEEYEIEIDDKFSVMDLPEDDKGWNKIPADLEQELISAVRETLPSCDPVDVYTVEEIYNPEGETLYRQGWL